MKFQKGHKPFGRVLKGHITTPETRAKISNANGGKKRSEEFRKNVSNRFKDKPKLEEHKANLSRSLRGRFVPSPSLKTRKKISGSLKGRKNTWVSKEHQQKMVEAARKINLGKKKSKEHNLKNKEWHLNNPNKKFKDTGIELKIEEELINHGLIKNVDFYKNVSLYGVANVDFYIPEHNIVIECDGCYWHRCPIHHLEDLWNRRSKDAIKTSILVKNGINVYRFWEHEINESPENCINKVTCLN